MCHVSRVTCHMSRVTCHMSRVTCHMSHVTCHMSCVTCHVSHVTCHMSHITCHNFNFNLLLFFFLPPPRKKYRSYDPHQSRDSLSPVCGIFLTDRWTSRLNWPSGPIKWKCQGYKSFIWNNWVRFNVKNNFCVWIIVYFLKNLVIFYVKITKAFKYV